MFEGHVDVVTEGDGDGPVRAVDDRAGARVPSADVVRPADAPVVRVADALERAVAEDRIGCPTALYLGRLLDAIGCEAMDEEAFVAWVAAQDCARSLARAS